MAVDIVIYHNSECGTSRNTLGLIRNAGIEPHIIEYLKTPPARALLVELIDRAGISPLGVKLCRPSEAVLDLLPADQLGAFAKEDGQQVVGPSGQRVA